MISLDFELFWGMRDHRTLAAYGANIRGVREALPAMLRVFDAHGVKTTWATVGLLFFADKGSLLHGIPQEQPTYVNDTLSPYGTYLNALGTDEAQDPHHFGLQLIRTLQQHPAHEIGCHTFSHYYCLEPGQTSAQFRADLRAWKKAASAVGATAGSLVFPRNQTNAAYLAICAEEGIGCYRGDPDGWLYAPRSRQHESPLRRGLRLLDTWLPLSGHNTHALPPRTADRPINIPASRFLRPYHPRLRALEGLRLRRITTAMDHAAQNGRLFHLWWHPHNFGVELAANLRMLERILAHYDTLRERYGFRSMTMSELAATAHG